MSDTRGREHVTLSVDPRAQAGSLEEVGDRPFQILVLGDFSGRDSGTLGARGRVEDRRPIRVGTVDDALDTIRPSVDLEIAGVPTRIEFGALEDFHPDRLVERIPRLRDLVERVDREDATGPVASDAPDAPDAPRHGGDVREPPAPPPTGLLEDIVAATPERASLRDAGAVDDLRPWLREVVAPYLEEAHADADEDLVRRHEAKASAHVRDVLHHPAVRALERSWRSLFLLSRAVDPVEDARLYVLDVARSELEELLGDGEPRDSLPFRVLSEELPGPGGDTPVGLLVGGYAFGPEAEDVLFLNRLAILAHLTGAPLLVEASSRLLGLDSFAALPAPGRRHEPTAGWAAFRGTEAAASVALLAPRVLLREPYGPDSDPCEAFAFDELDPARGSTYLWGSPAFVAAAAAIEAFASDGWGLALVSAREREGMPIHVTASGAVGAHPTEVVWSQDVVEFVLAAGVSPVIGFRDQTRVRLPGVSSVSLPRAPLAGWWSR
jgi:type VI secretion system protein ImpC